MKLRNVHILFTAVENQHRLNNLENKKRTKKFHCKTDLLSQILS